MPPAQSMMIPLGLPAPTFKLPHHGKPGPSRAVGDSVSLRDDLCAPKVVVVMFLCNHCPFVRHLAPHIAQLASSYASDTVAFVGISANDVSTHPADAPEKMVEEAEEHGYTFPYLYDATQETAKAYRAACTPDFFVFDGGRKLVYRGQYDDSRPGNGIPVTGRDLSAAIDAALWDHPPLDPQTPSMGCGIKWKKGATPDYLL